MISTGSIVIHLERGECDRLVDWILKFAFGYTAQWTLYGDLYLYRSFNVNGYMNRNKGLIELTISLYTVGQTGVSCHGPSNYVTLSGWVIAHGNCHRSKLIIFLSYASNLSISFSIINDAGNIDYANWEARLYDSN